MQSLSYEPEIVNHLSSYQVDYSDLVTALQEQQEGTANRLLRQLMPRLKKYLGVVLEARDDDAEEAVYRAFFGVYEKILEGKIKQEKYIYKYLLKSCRHEYIHMMRRRVRVVNGDNNSAVVQAAPAEQIENLLDKDKQRILASCLRALPEESRAYITYILNHPNVSTKGLSAHFGMSESNVRVKKSRIIRDLNHCVKKKLDE